MPWLYNTKTGDVEHQNAAEWAADQLFGGLTGLVNLNIPDSSTSAQAVAAAQKYVAAHGGTAPTTSGAQANANALASLTGTGEVAVIWAKLTDGKMWRSLGWLLLGVALVIVGMLMWIGPGAVKASPYGRALGAIRGAR